MASTTIRPKNVRRNILKPTAAAFLLAYLSTTFPKIGSVLISHLRKHGDLARALNQVRNALASGLALNRFPAFCTVVVGGSTALRDPINHVFQTLDTRIHGRESLVRTRNNRVAARFVAAVLSAIVGFRLLNSPSNPKFVRPTRRISDVLIDGDEPRSKRPSKIPSGLPPLPAQAVSSKPSAAALGAPLAGKTMDLTLFAVARAADVLAQWYWQTKKTKGRLARWWDGKSSPILFALSSALIMNAFFYAPARLPYTYVQWIGRIAECDERLIHALRQARYGNFVYGKDTGMAPLLGSMAKEYNLPEEYGDPAKTIPVPCELVHHGCGPSCEKHALWRFWRSWKLALGVYAPLQALVVLRRLQSQKVRRLDVLRKASVDTARSSAFLGAFVALFYYGVCLTRTRLVPKLFSRKTITPQMYDSGLCVLGGCLLCGWSVLLELAHRQAELMLFVLPRALGVWFPRRYLREHRWREEIAFAISTAIVLTAAQERPDRIRGVFGRLLKQVMPA
ncbi:uncharacterized protein PV09_02707 [Verruconis gallopava]|uniref:Integral membrane protein n=1 Tax=Verruconis gallopava TaxID=253628 RepID=A0A0D1XTX6_9PEZI|nr:uncharacterized protein PV09_02707 [Verruconis gallopava]KIW06231.1 hypothetical protein PV09_02707 [Verruconis gallopava]